VNGSHFIAPRYSYPRPSACAQGEAELTREILFQLISYARKHVRPTAKTRFSARALGVTRCPLDTLVEASGLGVPRQDLSVAEKRAFLLQEQLESELIVL
jgi:hypothetical protein